MTAKKIICLISLKLYEFIEDYKLMRYLRKNEGGGVARRPAGSFGRARLRGISHTSER